MGLEGNEVGRKLSNLLANWVAKTMVEVDFGNVNSQESKVENKCSPVKQHFCH